MCLHLVSLYQIKTWLVITGLIVPHSNPKPRDGWFLGTILIFFAGKLELDSQVLRLRSFFMTTTERSSWNCCWRVFLKLCIYHQLVRSWRRFTSSIIMTEFCVNKYNNCLFAISSISSSVIQPCCWLLVLLLMTWHHPLLSCAWRIHSTRVVPTKALMLSVHLCLGLPLLRLPSTDPSIVTFSNDVSSRRAMWPKYRRST